MTIGERVKEVRKSSGLTLEKFGAKIKIRAASVSLIENGKNNPTDRTIDLICREFGVREEWLRTGEGSMTEDKSRDEQIAEAVGRILSGENPDFKRRLITVLSTLNEQEWRFLQEKMSEIVGQPSPAADTGNPVTQTREQEAAEVAAKVYAAALDGGEKVPESGTPPAGAGIA